VGEETAMPRIRDEFLDCVVYLYPSHKDADDGTGIGGSGFILCVPSQGLKNNFLFPYFVTNSHVIVDGNAVVRMTTRDGKKHIIETDERKWHKHPSGDDLAVYLISLNPAEIRFNHISDKHLMSKKDAADMSVGVGDDVFVVGRFINHEGQQKNIPTARFGCVGQMPNEPIKIGGFDQECFLVEARSIGGFSGSPVFWHVLPFSGGAYRPGTNVGLGPLLLGVELGYIYDWTPVCDSNGDPINAGTPCEQKVQVNSGMMIVVPAWKLHELIFEGAAMTERKKIEDEVREKEPKSRGGVQLSAVKRDAVDAADDANPNHLADFTRLVDVAARKKPKDHTKR
jgi:hypothetical protein